MYNLYIYIYMQLSHRVHCSPCTYPYIDIYIYMHMFCVAHAESFCFIYILITHIYIYIYILVSSPSFLLIDVASPGGSAGTKLAALVALSVNYIVSELASWLH